MRLATLNTDLETWDCDLRHYATVQVVDADLGWVVVVKAPGNVSLMTKGNWIYNPTQSLLRYADEN